jgi:hypothetical protein
MDWPFSRQGFTQSEQLRNFTSAAQYIKLTNPTQLVHILFFIDYYRP